jgi:hypothetical protein
MRRRSVQAASLSFALHAALLGSLFLIRPHAGEGPSRVSIIHGEVLFDAGAWNAQTLAAAERNGATAARALPVPERPEPTDAADEPAGADPVAEANPPAPADGGAAADSTPAETLAAEQRAAAIETPAPDGAASVEPLATDTLGEPSPLAAETPTELPPAGATPADVATAPLEAVESVAAAEAAAAAEAPGGEARVVVAMEAHEQAMIEKRFASWNGRFTPGDGAPSVDWKQNGQAYTAVFRAPSATDPMGIEHIVVDVTTEQGGKKMSTQLTMTRLAFSNFAQFVDKWDPSVQIHDDVIGGRFHSNTPISLLAGGGASPQFLGKVTIASHALEATSNGGPFSRRKVFPEGVDTGVRRIVLPSRLAQLLNEAAHGDEAVQRFERDAQITFYGDGTYGWRYLDDGAAEQRRRVIEPAHYLIGLEHVTLHIKGIVNGKVLVYSPDEIVIEDDLRYAAARGAHDADDYLGLVAEGDVEIAEPKITGHGDLTVEASIYARGTFAVRNFRSARSGTLAIYGSVTAGSLTATEPRFATKIEFDPRLANARPPSFPLTDRYELASWDGEWRVDEEAN